MTNEEALKLIPGVDRVAFHDEGIQDRVVTNIQRGKDGTVYVHATGDTPQVAEAKDVR